MMKKYLTQIEFMNENIVNRLQIERLLDLGEWTVEDMDQYGEEEEEFYYKR